MMNTIVPVNQLIAGSGSSQPQAILPGIEQTFDAVMKANAKDDLKNKIEELKLQLNPQLKLIEPQVPSQKQKSSQNDPDLNQLEDAAIAMAQVPVTGAHSSVPRSASALPNEPLQSVIQRALDTPLKKNISSASSDQSSAPMPVAASVAVKDQKPEIHAVVTPSAENNRSAQRVLQSMSAEWQPSQMVAKESRIMSEVGPEVGAEVEKNRVPLQKLGVQGDFVLPQEADERLQPKVEPVNAPLFTGTDFLEARQALTTKSESPADLRRSVKSLVSNESVTAPAGFATPPALMAQSESQAQVIDVRGDVVPGAMTRERLSTHSLQELTNGIQAMGTRPDGGEMRIRLKPESLGELHLRVMTEGNQVSIKVNASSEKAKKVLEETVSHLKAGLATHHLHLHSVDFEVIGQKTGVSGSPLAGHDLGMAKMTAQQPSEAPSFSTPFNIDLGQQGRDAASAWDGRQAPEPDMIERASVSRPLKHPALRMPHPRVNERGRLDVVA